MTRRGKPIRLHAKGFAASLVAAASLAVLMAGCGAVPTAGTTPHMVARQDACSAIEAVQTSGQGALPPLSCTDLTAKIPGQRLTVAASQNGQHIRPAQPRRTVSKGTRFVSWPANAATAKLVNDGLSLFGGSAALSGEVPLIHADTLVEWSFTFTQPGTHRFAIVGDTAPTVTVSTVTVTG